MQVYSCRCPLCVSLHLESETLLVPSATGQGSPIFCIDKDCTRCEDDDCSQGRLLIRPLGGTGCAFVPCIPLMGTY